MSVAANGATRSNTRHAATSPLPPATHETPLLTLVWLKRDDHVGDAAQIVQNMLRHSCGPYGRTAIVGGDARLAWGILRPEKHAPLACWSVYRNERELCLIEGDLYDDLPGSKLQPGDNPSLARHVTAQMRQAPNQRVTGLIGIYSGVYVAPDLSCAYAFGDLTGTRPVFWLSDEKRFVVTNNLWAFRGCDGFERRWDPMALSQMLTIGFPLVGRTWLAGVKLLQRGRQVRSFADGRTQVRMLLDPVDRQECSLQESVRVLRENLDEAVGGIARRLGGPVGLALSGGLDSRTLLASLHSQKLDHRNFTYCVDPGEPDIRVARSVTALLGEPHDTLVLNGRTPITHIEYRLINEGESPGFGMLRLAAHAQQYTKALFIGSELVRETAGTFQPLSVKSKRDLADRMLAEYLRIFTPEQLSGLLAPAYCAPWSDVFAEWVESFEQIDQPSVMDVFLDHVADYRVQRRTRPRLDQARWYCLPIYPYMDERIYRQYRRLPLSHVHGERAPLALLADYKLGLEKLPSAARRFGMPICQEYRYRHVIRLGRVVQEKLLPMQERWRVSMGRLGLGRSVLHPTREAELLRLQHSELFQGPGVRDILQRARRGTFVNGEAIHRMVNAGVIDDFLFGSGFVRDRSLGFLQSLREIQWVPS